MCVRASEKKQVQQCKSKIDPQSKCSILPILGLIQSVMYGVFSTFTDLNPSGLKRIQA